MITHNIKKIEAIHGYHQQVHKDVHNIILSSRDEAFELLDEGFNAATLVTARATEGSLVDIDQASLKLEQCPPGCLL